jgi:TatA/E family protein of Tat protein translocase
MPLGFHWYELIPLVLIALLIFGPKKLPELGSSIGKTIKEFQKSMREVTDKPEETPAPPQVTTSVRPELSAPSAASSAATTTAPTTQAPTPQQPPV